jgi:hypothetical protein
MAIEMPLFRTPSIKKNVFTMLRSFSTSKICSTRTSHSIQYGSQEALLHVVQVFDANESQSLLTLAGRVQKTIFFFLQIL